MGEGLGINLEKEVNTLCSKILKAIEDDTENYREMLEKWRELHFLYLNITEQALVRWAEKAHSPSSNPPLLDKIEADGAVVEVVDKRTGKVFRRNLPIQYLETDNGVMLKGETMEGTPTQIAFYSDTAVARMNDIMGKGPDTHRCNGG